MHYIYTLRGRTVRGLQIGLLTLALLLTGGISTAWAQHDDDHGDDYGDGHGSASRFSDKPIPLIPSTKRPRPLIEIGPKFLGSGNINDGFEIPTGAVWTPALMVFGTLRSGVNGISDGLSEQQFGEAVGRADLFANLYLTQTERIVAGFRPLTDGGQFTQYTFFHSEDTDENELVGFDDGFNGTLTTLFVEGDFIELFPKLDWNDSAPLDFYFGVGRQPLSFQQDMLVAEDILDMVGLTKANLRIGSFVNTRATGIFAWNQINRPGDPFVDEQPCGFFNCEDENALVFGLLTETDTYKRTIELDALFITSEASDVMIALGEDEEIASHGGSGVYGGLSSTRRIGQKNNTFRALISAPVGDETVSNQFGVLLVEQLGWTPHHTHDWIYITGYAGIGEYRPAVVSPIARGPLGPVGILFAGVGLGRYGAALSPFADNAVGGSIGYQKFFGHFRRSQIIVEVGGRYTYDKDAVFGLGVRPQDRAAVAAQYARAIGSRIVFSVDAFSAYDFTSFELPNGQDTDTGINFGGRFEFALNL